MEIRVKSWRVISYLRHTNIPDMIRTRYLRTINSRTWSGADNWARNEPSHGPDLISTYQKGPNMVWNWHWHLRTIDYLYPGMLRSWYLRTECALTLSRPEIFYLRTILYSGPDMLRSWYLRIKQARMLCSQYLYPDMLRKRYLRSRAQALSGTDICALILVRYGSELRADVWEQKSKYLALNCGSEMPQTWYLPTFSIRTCSGAVICAPTTLRHGPDLTSALAPVGVWFPK